MHCVCSLEMGIDCLEMPCDLQTTGGRNGYGAKLANAYSREFVVETADGANTGKRYKQVFRDNMSVSDEPRITDCAAKDNWTKVPPCQTCSVLVVICSDCCAQRQSGVDLPVSLEVCMSATHMYEFSRTSARPVCRLRRLDSCLSCPKLEMHFRPLNSFLQTRSFDSLTANPCADHLQAGPGTLRHDAPGGGQRGAAAQACV